MSFEVGGRADKLGNVYENRYLAQMLIQLVTEQITSVVVEPQGENTDVCEFYTIGKNGRKTYFQCKSSNGVKNNWSPSDLKKYNLFSRVQNLLRSDPDCEFCFVSPVYYNGLDDLCSRAKRCLSPEEYIQDALANEQLRTMFEECEKNFGLSRKKTVQLSELVNILSRCEFQVWPNNSDMVKQLEQLISVYFWGEAGVIRILLENYVNDTASFGKELTATDVFRYLSEKGIQAINQLAESRIVPTVFRLNNSFSESYHAIQDMIFHRDSTDLLVSEIKAGNSIILHGKAGTGKSGCIHELINYLEHNHIEYLAIQLDKHIPKDYADKYGESIGLPGSPVSSISRMSGTKPCVLIFDQLDSLRWTAIHSSVALDVCKEMITQVRAIKENTNKQISIVLSVRTFDYENDTGIQALFNDEQGENCETHWSVISVGSLTDDEVRKIVGKEYDQLSAKVKELIHTPSSLYVWLKLEKEKRTDRFASAQDMIGDWWKQVQEKYSAGGHNQKELAECISEIVIAIINSNSFIIPRAMFLRYTPELEYLASSGMLIVQDETISFAHQSFLDSFLLENDLKSLYFGRQDLLSLVLAWGDQIPVYRYRLSALLQNISESDQRLFANQAKVFLESSQVHYYYKAAVFETIGQLISPVPTIYEIVDEYFSYDNWHDFILQTVYKRHPVFVKYLWENNSYDWSSEEGCSILESVKDSASDMVVSIIRDMLETATISFQKVISILGAEIDVENETLFSLRREAYEKDYSCLASIHYINLERAQPMQVLQVLAMFISDADAFGNQSVYIGDINKSRFCKENYNIIINSLFKLVCISGKNTPLGFHTAIDFNNRYWYPRETKANIIRDIVDIVKMSLRILANNFPDRAMLYIMEAGKYRNGISNELALSTVIELPLNYSDTVIEWLLCDFDYHILDCIGNEYDYLSMCKDILRKFSSSCSNECFAQLENKICTWKGDRERFVESYKSRIRKNRLKEQAPVYWPVWGHLQKALLPFLEVSRTSKKTKDLLAVLNRNKWVHSEWYHAGLLSCPARPVVATIHNNRERLSDKTWLEIINANVGEQQFGMQERNDNSYYYESSHEAFAHELGYCVKKDPTRYAKLLLKFPTDCYSGYYSSIIYSLRNINMQHIDFNLICEVVRHSIKCASNEIALAIGSLINEHPGEKWPEDVIEYLVVIAEDKKRLERDVKIITSKEEDTFPSPEDMQMSVLNSARSLAVETIGSLLLNHSELLERFVSVMETLVQEQNSVMRYALVKCAAAYYAQDSAFSERIFERIIKDDSLSLCSNYAFKIMSKDIKKLEEHYFEYFKEASGSSNPKVVAHVAQLVCITAINTSSEKVLTFLFSYSWTEETIDKICQVAVKALEKEDYHRISQTILEHFIDAAGCSVQTINKIFHEGRLDLKRDIQFVKHVLQKQHSVDTMVAFIDFANTQDTNLNGLSEIIKNIVGSIDESIPEWQKYRLEEGLIHVVIKLIDASRDDIKSTEDCLDILDFIYQKRILTESAVYKVFDGVE